MRYMDYEEFNKEYKEFSDWWNNSEEFSKKADELIWGKDAAMNRAAKKFTLLEGKHAKNDMWLDIDKWTGQEDEHHRLLPKPIRGLAENSITSTNFTPDDRVNSPSHYTRGKQEVIDTIEESIQDAPTPIQGMLQAQVLKYMLRVWLKDSPLEDLKKAQWYLTRLIDKLEGEQ